MLNFKPLGAYGSDLLDGYSVSALYQVLTGAQEDVYENLTADEVVLIRSVFEALTDNESFSTGGKNNYYTIRRLGVDNADEQNSYNTDQAVLCNAVQSLLCCGDSVGVSICSEKGVVRAMVQGKGLSRRGAEAALRSWTECAELEEYHPNMEKLGFSGYATILRQDTDREVEPNAFSNWMTALADAGIKEDFTVTAFTEKLSEVTVKQKIERLSALSKQLSLLQDIGINIDIGVTDSENIAFNKGDWNPKKAIHVMGQYKTSSETLGDSISASVSRTTRLAVIDALQKRVTFALNELGDNLLTGMYRVYLVCSARNISDYNVITSILTAALNRRRYGVFWTDNSRALSSVRSAAELPAKNLHHLFALPEKDFPGFRRSKNARLSVNSVDEDGEIRLGEMYWNGTLTDTPFRVKKNKLNRHLSVFGMTGCGKSNTVFSLIEQSGVPFLVIEPVKGEYRGFKRIYSDLQVHHMDPQREGVLRVNPFWFPPEGSLSFHMDAIKKIISSAFSLYAAMPNILEQCIYNCYVNKGWNIVRSTNIYSGKVPEEYLYPTFSDLCGEIESYLDKSGFVGETLSTYRGALLSRLKSFTTGIKGVLLNSAAHPDFNSWLNARHVVELDGLADDADKSVVMGTLIMQYFQCVKAHVPLQNRLNHLIVVEEAHRLFKNGPQGGNPEVAAPEAQLVDTLSNMMAEIRAYGEGFIIVDQSPCKIAADVVSNSSTKIIHRLDNRRDIDMIEDSMLMENLSMTVSALSQGDALVRTEGMDKPVRLHISRSKFKDYGEKIIMPPAQENLDSASQVDFILNNDNFSAEYGGLMVRFVNHILLDDLDNAPQFFSATLKKLETMLYLHGYSDIAAHGGKQFYMLLLRGGVKKALDLSYPQDHFLKLQAQMFAAHFCAILADGSIKKKEIKAFDAFRAEVLHELIERKNRNGAPAVHGIARLCGFYSIYSDLLLWLAAMIPDGAVDSNSAQTLSIEAVQQLVEPFWTELFVIPPALPVKDNIVLLLRMVYRSTAGTGK